MAVLHLAYSNAQGRGIILNSVKTPGDTGGIILEGRWDNLRHLSLKNIREDGLKMGIAGNDTGLYRLEDVRIGNWTATNMGGPCLILNGSVRVDVDQFQCSESRANAPWAFSLSGRETTLRNGLIQCGDSQGCGAAGKDAIVDRGRSDRIESVKGVGFGGSLVRTSPHRGGTAVAALDASGMGGRSASVYVEPTASPGERLGVLWLTTKPYLRIFWTRYITWLGSLRPWQKVHLLWGVPVFLVFVALSQWSSYRRRTAYRRR